MKRVRRWQRHYSQRGAVGGQSDPNPSLPELLQQVEGLETRLQQLKTGIANLVQLQQAEAAPPPDGPRAAQELVQLQEAADAFELELATRVISWQHLQEPFWQGVRFGGLGLLLGWVLAWFVYRG